MKTTVNGKEIELIDMDGIRFLYDKLVRNFLDIGFQLTFGDSGSQGEMAKVDLINPLDTSFIYRVWVWKDYEKINDECIYHADTVNFAVKKYENDGRTLWMSKGTDVIVQEKLYRISDRCREVYCRTVDEWLAIHNVSLERSRARHSVGNERMTESFSRKALTVIRKRKGFKSTKLSDIINIERRNGYGYIVELKSKTFNSRIVHLKYNRGYVA